MTVTAIAAPERTRSIRNERILEEWMEPSPALVDLLMGVRGEDEQATLARSLANYLKASAFQCGSCQAEFGDGDTVYRLRRGPGALSLSQAFKSVCLACVSSWHESWLKAMRNPHPCEGGCGVLVTSPYRDLYSWHNGPHGTVEEYTPHARYCSNRCREQATRARRRKARPCTCAACGELFTPKRSDARYCSSACRQDAYRRRKNGLA